MVHLHSGILHHDKKEWGKSVWINMERSLGYIVKWKKMVYKNIHCIILSVTIIFLLSPSQEAFFKPFFFYLPALWNFNIMYNQFICCMYTVYLWFIHKKSKKFSLLKTSFQPLGGGSTPVENACSVRKWGNKIYVTDWKDTLKNRCGQAFFRYSFSYYFYFELSKYMACSKN